MAHTFGQFNMMPGTDRSVFADLAVQALMGARKVVPASVDHFSSLSLEDEEADLADMDPALGSVSLERPRNHAIAACQALVRDAFARHHIPTTTGMDIGSGATGYMYGKLLPESAKAGWIQMELSPAAAQMNRERNPGSTVVTGSYHRLSTQGVTNMLQVISGLSSLDATAHIDHAVEEIRQALQQGGYLLHVQDTRPGLIIAQQEWKHLGATPPYQALALDDPNALANRPIVYRQGALALDVMELFRRRLGRALTDNGGFELLENQWITAVGPGTSPGVNKHIEFGTMVGLQSQGPKNIDAASAVITVARRKK